MLSIGNCGQKIGKFSYGITHTGIYWLRNWTNHLSDKNVGILSDLHSLAKKKYEYPINLVILILRFSVGLHEVLKMKVGTLMFVEISTRWCYL